MLSFSQSRKVEHELLGPTSVPVVNELFDTPFEEASLTEEEVVAITSELKLSLESLFSTLSTVKDADWPAAGNAPVYRLS